MGPYQTSLDLVEQGHLQFLGVGNALRLAQSEFSDRLVRALATRLRAIHETALGDVELWSKSAAAQLDAQLRERRRNFTRRIEAIDRIQQATGGLADRLGEISGQESTLNQLDVKLLELTGYLTGGKPVATTNTKPEAKPETKLDVKNVVKTTAKPARKAKPAVDLSMAPTVPSELSGA